MFIWFAGLLDFPSVNVTADQDGHVLFHFMHPWLFHHNKLLSNPSTKLRKKKSHDAKIRTPLPEFNYDVVIINQVRMHTVSHPLNFVMALMTQCRGNKLKT